MKYGWLIAVLVICLVAACVLIPLYGCVSMLVPRGGLPEQRDFDQTEWNDPDRVTDPPARLTMIRDVIERVLSTGMLRKKVESLLGPPDSARWSDYYPHPGWILGNWALDGFDNDTVGLILRFENDRLVAARGPDIRGFGTWDVD